MIWNFNWDGSARQRKPKRKEPVSIGAFLVGLLPSGTILGIAGAIGATGLGYLAIGVGYAAVIGGSLLLSGMLQKRPATPKASDVQSNIRQAISARRRWYGTNLAGSVIVFGFRRGEKSYLLHYIGEGPISGYVSYRLDHKPVTLDGSGFVTDAQYVVKGHSRVQILSTLGTMSDGPFAALIAAFPELDTPLTPFRHRGCAMVLQIVEQVPAEKLADTYPNNMPSLHVVINGQTGMFDPRTNSTGYSNLAGICLLNEIMDVYGYDSGDVNDIDFDSFADFIDICDESVTLKAGGTEKRYRCAGMVDLSAENEARITPLADACNADIYVNRKGQIAVREKLRTTPAFALREKNGDISDLQIGSGRSRQQKFNTVKVTYTEPLLNYKENEVQWVHSGLLAEDGEELSMSFSLPMCPSMSQAQRLGKQKLYEMNPEYAGNITSGPQALELLEDYCFTLDMTPEDDFTRVACANESIGYNADNMAVSTNFVVYMSGAKDWTAAVDEQVELDIPVDLPSNVDDVTLTVTVTAVIQKNSAPAIKATWVAAGAATLPDSYTQQFQISPAGLDDWSDAKVTQETNTALIGPVADGGAYDWRIRNIAAGKTFDWQVSSTPITIVVNPSPPSALSSFAATGSGQRLGHVPFSIVTPNDSKVHGVHLYRKATGASLNTAVDTPITSLAVGPSASYSYVDGDATRTNMLTTPDFSATGAWSLGTGWSISGGVATHVAGTSSNLAQSQTIGAVAYRIGMDVKTLTAGSVRPRLTGGTTVNPSYYTTTGFKLNTLTGSGSNDSFSVGCDSAFAGTVDDVVIYAQTAGCAPQGVWDYYAVPFNASGVLGPTSGPLTITVI